MIFVQFSGWSCCDTFFWNSEYVNIGSSATGVCQKGHLHSLPYAPTPYSSLTTVLPSISSASTGFFRTVDAVFVTQIARVFVSHLSQNDFSLNLQQCRYSGDRLKADMYSGIRYNFVKFGQFFGLTRSLDQFQSVFCLVF